MKNFILILVLLQLLTKLFGRPSDEESLKVCKEPLLGRGSAATSVCSGAAPDAACSKTNCADVRLGFSHPWWCGSMQDEWFTVYFNDVTRITGFHVQAASQRALVQFSLMYSVTRTDDGLKFYGTSQDNVKKIFDSTEMFETFWLEEWIDARVISIRRENNGGHTHQIQVEFYGCPHYYDSWALYYSTQEVTNTETVSHPQDGYLQWNDDEEINKVEFNFATEEVVEYFDIELPIESERKKDFLLVLSYTDVYGEEVSLLLTDHFVKQDGNTFRYVFNSPTTLKGQVFITPLLLEESRKVKLKTAFYTRNTAQATHRWSWHDDKLLDTQKYHHFDTSNEVQRSLPFPFSHCMLSIGPLGCKTGFTLQAHFNVPQTRYEFQYAATSTHTENCVPGAQPSTDWTLVHIDQVQIVKGTRLRGFTLKSADWEGATLERNIDVKIWINSPSSDLCSLINGNIEPYFQGSLKANVKDGNIKRFPLVEQMQDVVNWPFWYSGSSITVAFNDRPYDDFFYFVRLYRDVCDHSNPTKEVVNNLQDSSFTTNCAGDPSDVKFSKNDFYNLPVGCGDLYIDLENNYLVNKIKIKGRASAFPTEFELFAYSNKWVNTGHFHKSHPGLEYFYLDKPRRIKELKVKALKYHGSGFDFKIDTITCEDAPVDKEVLRENLITSMPSGLAQNHFMELEQETNGRITVVYINGNNQLGHNGDGPLIGSSDAKLLGRSKSFSKLDNTVFCHNQRFSISFLDGNHLLNGFVCGMDRVFTMSADLSIYVTLETDLSNHNQYPSTAIFDVQQDKLCADQHGMIFYTLTSDDYILQRTLTSDWQYLDKMGTKKCSVMNCDETGNVFCTSSNTIYVWSVETSSWTHLYDLWGQQFFKPLNNNRTQFCIVEQLPGKEVNYTVIAYKPVQRNLIPFLSNGVEYSSTLSDTKHFYGFGFQLSWDTIEGKIHFAVKEKHHWVNEFVFNDQETFSFSHDPDVNMQYQAFSSKVAHTSSAHEDLKVSTRLPWSNAIYIFGYGSSDVIKELVYFPSSAAFKRTIDNLIVFTEDSSYRKLQVPPQGLDYQINGITLLPNGQEHAPIISDTERLMDDNKEYVFTQYVFNGVNGQITSLNFLAQPYAILEFKDIELEFQTSSYLLTEMKIQNDLYGQIANGEAYLANTLVGLIDPDTETCIQDVSESCLPKLVEEVKLFSYALGKIPIFDYLKRKRRLDKIRFLLIFPKDNNAAVLTTDGIHWMRLKVSCKLKTNTEHLAFFPTPLQIEKKSPLIFTTRPIDLRNGNELLISSMHGCCGTLIISVKGITRPVFIKELKKSDENTQYTFNCQLNYAGAHQLVLVYLPTSLESYLIVDKIITKGTTYGPSLTSLTWSTEMELLSYPTPDIMKIALSIYADPSKDFGIYWYSVSNTGTIKIPDRYGFQNRGEKFSQSSSPPHIPKIKTTTDKIEYTMFTVIVDVKISHGEVGEEYLFQFGREESNINTHFTVTIQSGFIIFKTQEDMTNTSARVLNDQWTTVAIKGEAVNGTQQLQIFFDSKLASTLTLPKTVQSYTNGYVRLALYHFNGFLSCFRYYASALDDKYDLVNAQPCSHLYAYTAAKTDCHAKFETFQAPQLSCQLTWENYIRRSDLELLHNNFPPYDGTSSLGYFINRTVSSYDLFTNNNDMSIEEGIIDFAMCNAKHQKLDHQLSMEPCFERLEDCQEKMFSLGIVFRITKLGTSEQQIVGIGGYRLSIWWNMQNQTICSLSWNLNTKEAFKIEFICPFEVWTFMEFFIFEDRVVYYLNNEMYTVVNLQEAGYHENFQVQLADEDLDICFDEVTYFLPWREPEIFSKYKRYYTVFRNYLDFQMKLPTMTVEVICHNVTWHNDLLDDRTFKQQAISKIIIEALSDLYGTPLLPSSASTFSLYESEKTKASVELHFGYFLSRYPASILYESSQDHVFQMRHYTVLLSTQTTKSTLPYNTRFNFEVTYTEDPKPSYVIQILDGPTLNHQYEKGYFIIARNEDLVENAFEEQVLVGSAEIFHLQSVYLCKVEVSFWVRRMTHFGFGPSSSKVTFQGGESGNVYPTNITEFRQLNQSAMSIAWQKYPEDIMCANFRLFRLLIEETLNSSNVQTFEYVENANNTVVIDTLKSYTRYSLYLYAVNEVSKGTPAIVNFRTNSSAPDFSPSLQNLTYNKETGTFEIEISPYPDDKEIYNDLDRPNFFINFRSPIDEQWTWFDINATEINVTDATSFSLEYDDVGFVVYNVSLGATNQYGDAPTEDYCYLSPQADMPIYSLVIESKDLSEENDQSPTIELTLAGNESAHENMFITKYAVSLQFESEGNDLLLEISHSNATIEYWNQADRLIECSNVGPTPRVAKPVTKEMQLNRYYVNYTLTVMICKGNQCNLGSWDVPSTFQTPAHKPMCMVENLEFEVVSSTSLKLRYDAILPECLNGELVHYEIYLFKMKYHKKLLSKLFVDHPDDSWLRLNQSQQINTTDTEVVFENLNENRRYLTILRVVNHVGYGNFSHILNSTTLEDAPSTAPEYEISVIGNVFAVIELWIPQKDQNGIITAYRILFNDTDRTVTQPLDEEGVYHLSFEGLTPVTQYNLSISFLTAVGEGPMVNISIMTTAGRPEVPPNEISSLPSNDSLIYTWGVPYLELIYGAALTYNISHCGILRNGSQTCWFKQNQSIPTICEKVRDPHSIFTNCTLRVDGLLPSTFYTVNISHCGIEGCTNWTSFQSSTSEMAPSGQVPGVTVFGLTESINASWSLMEIMKRRGVIIAYNISARFITPLWWPVNESAVPQTLYFNSSTLSCLLYGLQNDSLYNVSVTALTSVGSGPWSEPVQIRTLQNVPTAVPINVSADGIRTEIYVDWIPIDRFYHQGILLGYNISFQAREPFPDRGGRLQGYNLSFLPNISHVVYGLNPLTTYDIRVSGFNEIGSGLWSEAINATTDPFIDGNWTEWTQWGNCEVSCGLGVSSRQRWCINPPPENGGAQCVNESKEYIECNDFPCDGFYLGKPGESCDKTCIDLSSEFLCNPLMELDNSTSQFLEAQDAYNYREKNANVSCISNSGTDKYTLLEDPQFNPLNDVCIGFRNLPNITDCSALPSENNNRRLCQCLDEKNVGYGEWTSWSLCEVSCGGGRARRSRACSIPFGGCSGPSMQVGDCNTDPCPIYGNWGQWGEYSECTKTCGFGVERRIRKCDSPKPQFGGEGCPGTDVDEIEGCNPMPCPVHGQWGSWGEFEKCLKPCGNQSLRISRRYCDSPKPLFDGLDCVGNNTKSEKCDFGNITCAEIPLNLVLRFVDEEWHFMMYRPQDPRIVDLRRRIMQNVMAFYRDNNIDTAFDLNNLRIDFHGQWKGSVVMNFTIIYPENPFVEVFMMQSELESGSLKNLSLVPQNITSKKLPLAPVNISLSSPQPFIINLSWKENPSNNYTEPKNDPFYLYYVFYAEIHDEANYKINKWINFGSKNTSVQLRDLESGSLYAVRILASTIKTMGLSTETQVIQVYEGPPKSKPQNTTHQFMDPRQIFISWDHIPKSEVPGKLRGYRIMYRIYQTNENVTLEVSGNINQKFIPGLKPYTWYWFEIWGFTRGGPGPVHVFMDQTPMAPPESEPMNVTIHEKYSIDQLFITWKPVLKHLQNGPLDGYKIVYYPNRIGGEIVGKLDDPIELTFDKYTFSWNITDLQSYTEYTVEIFAFNKVGTGPKVILLARTCNCPRYILTNFIAAAPYVVKNTSTIYPTYTGVFPVILQRIVDTICSDCINGGSSLLSYNVSLDGLSNEKESILDMKNGVSEDVQVTFPMFGKFEMTRHAGQYPYIGMVNSQGIAVLKYQPRIVAIGLWRLLTAVMGAWPVIMVAVLMCTIVGILFWFTELDSELEEVSKDSMIRGAMGGLWVAFITMTSVGYGDITPSTNKSKALMVIWVLAGFILLGIISSAIASGMSVGQMKDGFKLYGAKIGVIEGSYEYNVAVRRNGKVNESTTYAELDDLIEAVGAEEVEIGLVDSTELLGKEKYLEEKSIMITRILNYNTGYGFVLSGDLIRLESDFRAYITGNQAYLIWYIEKVLGRLNPTMIETLEVLLMPEEASTILLQLCGIWAVAVLLGASFSFIRETLCQGKSKVQPRGTPEQRYADVNTSLTKEVSSFHQKFTGSVEEISNRQDDEKIELDRLQRCYKSWKYRDNFHNIFKLEADLELHRTKKKERAAELKTKKATMYQRELDFKKRLQYN